MQELSNRAYSGKQQEWVPPFNNFRLLKNLVALTNIWVVAPPKQTYGFNCTVDLFF